VPVEARFFSLTHDLLILGASARAAAFSALRCRLRPYCADFFADRDLSAVCSVDRVDSASAVRGFAAVAESLPPSPWFYTGGFENLPDLVERIARRHRLWGNGAGVLRAVRDPIQVAGVLNKAGMPCPAVRLESRELPRDGTWLVKPIASGGGRGIEPLSAANGRRGGSHYFQERIEGPSYSALFIARGGRANLIGVTRQWIGRPGSPFAYRGNIGPCPVAPELYTRLTALGNRLGMAFGLVGWFGVDYILLDGIPWPVEINPRYTASIEIHELASASGRPLLHEHRRACEGWPDPQDPDDRSGSRPRSVIAKEILYAPRRVTVPELRTDDGESDDPFSRRSIADLPWPGTCFNAGEPVMTILAAGADVATCRGRLARLRRIWRQRLGFLRADPDAP
jgi:predicted ATP-grasp superfamily ATP-dependent carboligase